MVMGMTQKEIDARRYLKYRESLGTSLSTATMRLLRSIVFEFIEKTQTNTCHRCGLPMTRTDFSVEHIEDWRNKENALELFYDLSNISYSHVLCNTRAAKRGGWNKGMVTHGTSGYRLGCRCDICKQRYSGVRRAKYQRLKT
jgi:hypothetical protein